MKKEEFEIKARDLIIARLYRTVNGRKIAEIQSTKYFRIKEIEFRLKKQIENFHLENLEIEIFNATRNTCITYKLD